MSGSQFLLLVIILAAGLAWAYWLGFRSRNDEIASMQRSLDYYHKTYLIEQGWNYVVGNYYFVSFDAGETWWNAERAEKGLRIIGPAEPERLQPVLALRRLVALSLNKAPVDPSTDEGAQLLTDAGFTVERVGEK